MSTKNQKEIEATYTFMKNVYLGNWEYRFKGAPHMSNMFKSKKKESILAHELACIGFWFNLKRVCPNLNKLVNTEHIYEILWGHDLGEIYAGDVSQTQQVKGLGKNKVQNERQEIIKIAGKIPKKNLETLLKNFDAFEKKTEEMNKLEILVCKFIDNVQGNHFNVVFGNDFKNNSDLVNKILNRSFIRTTRRLLQVLKEGGHKKAHKEVELVATHLIDLFRKAGTELELEKF